MFHRHFTWMTFHSTRTVRLVLTHQIMGACVAYSQQEESAWPAPWPNTIGYVAPGQAITTGVAAMNYTFGCLEVLAHEASLPNALFRCPGCAARGPNTLAQPGMTAPEISGRNWADDGGGSGKRIGYAFDWAAPAETIGMHGADLVAEGILSEMGKGNTTTGTPDNIYNSVGDYPADKTEAQTALTPGRGDPNRAFVK